MIFYINCLNVGTCIDNDKLLYSLHKYARQNIYKIMSVTLHWRPPRNPKGLVTWATSNNIFIPIIHALGGGVYAMTRIPVHV